MKRIQSDLGTTILIVIGIALILTTIILHWTLPEQFEKVEVIPLIVGFIFSYYGALWKDPNRAKNAAESVAHTGGEVVDTLAKMRIGKRATDPVVEIKKSHPVDDPDAEPTVEVKVTNPGAPSVPKDGE